MKKILIDANPIVPIIGQGRFTGIGRTCLDLIKALDSIKNELPFEIELFTQNLHGVSAKKLDTSFKSYHVYLRNIPTCNKLARMIRLRELITKYDLQHITHNHEFAADPSRSIVTVHDAFFMKINDEQFDYSSLRKIYPPFIRACRHIITCSEYSKKDIVGFIGVDPSKITVIPWGINHEVFYVEDDKAAVKNRLRDEYGLNCPFLLSVSCDVGRKRTPDLINAWMSIENPVNDLVLVWGNVPRWVKDLVNDHPRIHFISEVSNDALRWLYNCCTASVNPTSYEGFGLPVLEAMACGSPVVTCSNSSIPEVGGSVAIYVEEPIVNTLPQKLFEIDRGLIDLEDIKRRGINQASQFSWENTARKTIKIYEQELANL